MFKKNKKPKPWEQSETTIELPDEYVLESADSPAEAPGGEPSAYTPLPPEALDAPLAPVKKKRNPRNFVILGLVVLVAAALIINQVMNSMKGPAPVYSEFYTAQRGDIAQALSTNGTIVSGESVTVYSPVNAPLASVAPAVGETVTKGEALFAYDTTDLERAVTTAGSAVRTGNLTAQESINKSNESQADADEYRRGVETMKQQRDIAQQRVDEAQAQLDKVTKANEKKLKKAQQALAEAQTDPSRIAEVSKYQQQIEQYQGAITAAQNELATATEDLEQHKALVSQLETARDSAEDAVLDSTQRALLSEQNVSAVVESKSAEELLATARAGISAPISGVVTSLEVDVGGLAGQYSPMCTIESLEVVDVELNLSRYDLENVREGQSATVTSLGNTYSGTVTHIDSMTTEVTTTTGVSSLVRAVVRLSNPNQQLTLGIDADVEIDTGSVTDVVVAPLDAIGNDVDGAYVFVVTPEGTAQRRSVTTGMASNTDVEITEGLTAGEVIATSPQNVTDGATVSDDPQYMPTADLMAMM